MISRCLGCRAIDCDDEGMPWCPCHGRCHKMAGDNEDQHHDPAEGAYDMYDISEEEWSDDEAI